MWRQGDGGGDSSLSTLYLYFGKRVREGGREETWVAGMPKQWAMAHKAPRQLLAA